MKGYSQRLISILIFNLPTILTHPFVSYSNYGFLFFSRPDTFGGIWWAYVSDVTGISYTCASAVSWRLPLATQQVRDTFATSLII